MAKKAKSTGMTKWDEQLAKEALAAKAMEASVATGSAFSIKGGVLSFNGNKMPGGKMAVVIVAHKLLNVIYAGKFSEDDRTGPLCFAIGDSADDLKPHEAVVKNGTAQCESCAGCPHNEWGSADTGRGKACGNRRRLALLSAGTLDAQGRLVINDEEEAWTKGEMAILTLPPTATKGFAAWVKQCADVLQRPPHGMIVQVTVEPDASTQVSVSFETLKEVPDDYMGIVMGRRQEALTLVSEPMQPQPKDAKPGKAKKPADKATKASRPVPGQRTATPAAAPKPGGFGAPAAGKGRPIPGGAPQKKAKKF